MTDVDQRPLFGKVLPYDGETLLSIVSRSAEANVHPRLGSFLRLAKIETLRPAFTPFTRIDDMGRLAERIGIPESELIQRTHGAMTGSTSSWVGWYGTILPRALLDAERYRFAPPALSKRPFQRAQWMVRPLTYCAETMSLLVSSCMCGRQQQWKYRSSMDRCEKCRRTLTDLPHEFLPQSSWDDARQVAALISHSDIERRSILTSLPHPFCDWEAGEAFAAIVELGAAITDSSETSLMMKIKHGDFSSYSADNLVIGIRFVRNWPDSLLQILKDTVTIERSSNLALCAGPFSRYFNSHNAPSKLRELIRLAVPDALKKMKFRPSGSRWRNGAWLDASGTITQNAASLKYNIDKKTLRRLDTAAAIGNVVKSVCGKNIYHETLLAASIVNFRECLTASACSKELGVPEYCLPAIAGKCGIEEAGDPDAVIMADGSLYTHKSFASVLARLESVFTPSLSGGISLYEMLQHRFHPMDWADTIAAISDQSLPCTRGHSEDGLLGGVLVDAEAAVTFLASLPYREVPSNVTVCCGVAGKLIGINAIAVGKAVSTRLLPCTGTKGRAKKLALSDLALFSQTYIVSSEVKRRFGVDIRALKRVMKAAGFSSVGKIHRIPLWLRADAEFCFAIQP